MSDDAMFCTQCGMAAGSVHIQNRTGEQDQQYSRNQQQYEQYNQDQQYQQYQQYSRPADPYDHTAEFSQEDISKNKLFCMIVYLGSIIGIIVALLATMKEDSPYTGFHIRQSLKIFVIEVILAIITVVLSWTIVFLVAGIICLIICVVIQLICFVQVCMGRAKEPAIIKRFGFLR